MTMETHSTTAPISAPDTLTIASFRSSLALLENAQMMEAPRLEPLFADDDALDVFRARHASQKAPSAPLADATGPLFLGLDAGSTTTKLVLIDP